MLSYPPFLAVSGLAQAAKSGHPLKQGQHGAAVALLQGALIDLGAKLPKSTGKLGAPDGIFGQETFTALKVFQTAQKMTASGIADKATLELLDKLLAAKTAAKVAPMPKPPVAPPPPRTAQYQLGTADPPLKADQGSGKWNSKTKEAVYVALKASIIQILPQASVIVGYDAAKHMAHYMGNTGRTYTIDLERMIEQVPSAREALELEAAQAQEFAEMLPTGKHPITSVVGEGGYNTKDENWNWYYAIGGYTSWGKGEVNVSNGATGREYILDFEYKFYDRYNWDKGKSVTLFGIRITDEFMAEFHRQGLAQELDCIGSVTRRLSWKHGAQLSKDQLRRPGSRA